MSDNKKVILINGTSSNWYEQVIFILKPSNINKVPVNLVGEAEKIISEYMQLKSSDKTKYINPAQNTYNKNVKIKNKPSLKSKSTTNKNFIHHLLNVSIFSCIVLVIFLLYKISF